MTARDRAVAANKRTAATRARQQELAARITAKWAEGGDWAAERAGGVHPRTRRRWITEGLMPAPPKPPKANGRGRKREPRDVEPEPQPTALDLFL